MGELRFQDIVELKKWQKIQDHFSEVLGIHLRTIDITGKFVTQPSGHSKLCEFLIRNAEGIAAHCKDYLFLSDKNIEKFWKDGENCCVQGCYRFFIPLKVRKETISYTIVGPVIIGKREKDEFYKDVAEQMGVDYWELLDALREIRTFTYMGIKSVIELLYDIGLHVGNLGYQNIMLKGIIPESPRILRRVYDFYVEQLLDALLEASYNFTGAERGSIMLLDDKTRELYIKRAKGINPDIVENARSKLGKGIAGIVAQDNKSLFIDDNIDDARIKKLLNNPQVRYAISVPLRKKNKVWGVLNLGTSRQDSEKFTSQSIQTLDTLAELAETVIGNVSAPEVDFL